jgi:general secretion pathway protein M
MSTMNSRASAGASTWWQREPRERAMLALMFTAILAFAWWYGAFVPLRHVRDDAKVRHETAATDLSRVQAELGHLVQLRSRMPPRPIDAMALRRAVIDSAAQAGLTISRERDADAATSRSNAMRPVRRNC